MGWRFVCEQPVDRSSGDVVSRRRLVTGMATGLATAAAFGGVATEASAQTAREGAAPSHLRFLNPPTSPKNPTYTQAIEATVPGRILYLSGQQGLDVDDKLAGSPGDFRAQAEQAFLNIKGALAAAGGGMEHVVKLNHYFIDLRAHFKILRDIRATHFDPARQPASTMVQVGILTRDGALYEVEAVAVLPPA
jgi:enamine deaminase RidA (YjgF/YER057c/UK114 family)